MRILTITLVLALLLSAAAATTQAAGTPPHAPAPASDRQEAQQRPVDDNDDTRVEVQLVMLGVAAFTVLGVGTAGYLLRKKLGLVAGPPEQPAGGHH